MPEATGPGFSLLCRLRQIHGVLSYHFWVCDVTAH